MLRPGVYGADGAAQTKHIRSLKDVQQLKLTERPENDPANEDEDIVRFICPLTRRDMDGTVPFVYMRGCGCVLSVAGLKNAGSSGQTNCPVCAEPIKEDAAVTINPVGGEAQRMKDAWDAIMAREKEEKKAKKAAKRKSEAIEGGQAKDVDEPETKRSKPLEASTAKATAPRLPSVVAQATQLAAERAKKSSAISSLYNKPEDPNAPRKNDFMLRTFNRFA